jgi:hypothetical protein
MNRRKYLAAVGKAALVSKLPTSRLSSGPSPTEFLISSTEIPATFTRARTPTDIPLFHRLRSTDASFADAPLASRGFWTGGTERNPEWVLTTAACVAPDETLVDSATRVTAETHHEFIDEYDEETSSRWQFERRHEQHPRYHAWSADLWIDELLLDGSQVEGERHVFTDTMRLQARGSVLVWTGLFGPVEQSFQEWPYARLLDRITEYQQTKLDAVSDEVTSVTAGGST